MEHVSEQQTENEKNIVVKNEMPSRNSLVIAGAILLASFVISGTIFVISSGGQYQGSVVDTNQQAPAGNQNIADAGQPEAQAITVVPVTEKDWVRGNRNAAVSIIEYSDTECPFCKRLHPTLQKLEKDYAGKVNWVYRHAPLVQLHSKAPKEAEATECAGEQKGNDGFWKYLDALFEKTPANNGLDPAELPKIARSVGLDVERFDTCLASGKYAEKVAEQLRQAEAAGLQGTPYSIIVAGDQKIPLVGAVPEASFKAAIDPLLK